MTTFQGAWPALITPSTPDGGVHYEALQRLTTHLLAHGIGGLYVCGATGEGLLMSVAERKRTLEEVVALTKGKAPIIVHVGCVATRDAVELARHAQEIGAAGVSSVLPVLNPGLPSAVLHYAAIAAAAPGLPFFPYLYGGQTDATTLMRELAGRIPNLGGAKYTGPNMYELRGLIDLGAGRWTIFSGMDEQCALAAMFGAPGNIGSTLNVMPGIYRRMHQAVAGGDFGRARDLQLQANRVTAALISFGVGGALREAMRLLGLECGEPRLPTAALAADQRVALRGALDAAGWAEVTAM